MADGVVGQKMVSWKFDDGTSNVVDGDEGV